MELHDHEGGHSHSHDEGIVIEPYLWKMLSGCGSIWLFFMLQMVLQSFVKGHKHSHGTGAQTTHESQQTITQAEKDSKNQILPGISYNTQGTYVTHKNQAFSMDDSDRDSSVITNGKGPVISDELTVNSDLELASGRQRSNSGSITTAPDSLGWMVCVGDGIHNLADGLAIGASFAIGWRSGVSTSIAVFCHELPHEFGDVGILLSCGWSLKRIALFQMVSAFSAFIGLYIGIPVSDNEEVRHWIFIITAGMFLYIALADVVPELLEIFSAHKKRWRVFAAANGGALLGFGTMLVIAIFEEKIAI